MYHVIIRSSIFALIDLMYYIARIVRISFLLVKSDAHLTSIRPLNPYLWQRQRLCRHYPMTISRRFIEHLRYEPWVCVF